MKFLDICSSKNLKNKISSDDNTEYFCSIDNSVYFLKEFTKFKSYLLYSFNIF